MQGERGAQGKIRARRLFFSDAGAVVREMARLGVDPAGIEIMAGKAEHYLIHIENISSKAANIIKQEALARGADLAVPWKVANFAPGPTEAILMGTRAALTSLAGKLRRQAHFRLTEVAGLIERILAGDRLIPGRGRMAAGSGLTLDFGRKTYLIEACGGRASVGRGKSLVDDLLVDDLLVDDLLVDDLLVDDLLVDEGLTGGIAVPNVRDAGTARMAARAGAALVRLDPLLAGEALTPVLKELAAPGALLILGPGPAVPIRSPDELIGDLEKSLLVALETAAAAGIGPERVILECPCQFGAEVSPDRVFVARLAELRSLGCPLLINLGAGSQGGDPDDPPPWSEASAIAWVVLLALRGADMLRVGGSPGLIEMASEALRAVDAVAKD